MAAPTVVAVYTSHSNDGGNVGKAVTTDSNPQSGDYLVFAMGVNANGDTLTPPGGGWTEATVSDNSCATTGGQYRAWYLKDPATSTTYTWTVGSSTRRTCIALLLRGVDGSTPVDVKASSDTAPGSSHAPPSVTTTGADRLVVDFAGLRQFAPDTANWTVPASGLTWTEQADLQGSDSNNNVRFAAGTATAASAGAVSTTAWTNSDANEDALIIRVAFAPAATTSATWTPQQPRRRTWPRTWRTQPPRPVDTPAPQENPPYIPRFTRCRPGPFVLPRQGRQANPYGYQTTAPVVVIIPGVHTVSATVAPLTTVATVAGLTTVATVATLEVSTS